MNRVLGMVLAASASLAGASTVPSQWYFGNWACLIDGRPAQMVWRVVDDPQTSCDGDICTTSSGVAIRGWFKDGSGPWIRLERPRVSGNDFRFVYTGDRTNWFLRAAAGRRFAAGNTIWQDNAYPLSCVKR